MKVVISQEQNDRLMKLMKEYADTFNRYPVKKTETSIKYDPSFGGYYVIHPTFYMDDEFLPILNEKSVKIRLEDYVSDFFGAEVIVNNIVFLPFK